MVFEFCVYKCGREWKFQVKLKVHKILIFLITIYSLKVTLLGVNTYKKTNLFCIIWLVCSNLTFEIWVLD